MPQLRLKKRSIAYGWKMKSDGTPIDASDEAANNALDVGKNRIAGTYASANRPGENWKVQRGPFSAGDNILNAHVVAFNPGLDNPEATN